MMRDAADLRRWQVRIVAGGWVAYAGYYLTRVNIATALPDLQSSLSLSRAEVGLITSGFFWAYAAGQLLNGWLGDRVSPRRFMVAGMLASAVANLLFAAQNTWVALMALWTVNGYFQATGWGPSLRILANWLTPVQRRRIAGIFSSCFVAGNAATWLLSGWLVAAAGWRAGFWLPALILVVIAVGWSVIARDTPAAVGLALPAEAAPATEAGRRQVPTATLLQTITLLAAAFLTGLILVALIVWLPSYYVEIGGLGIGAAAGLAALLPVSGIAGTILAGWLIGRYGLGHEGWGLGGLLIGLALLFGTLPGLPQDVAVQVAAFCLVGAMVYAATGLMLTTLPLALGGQRRSSTFAGLVDFAFNLGAGFSGWLVGAVLQDSAWQSVFLWLAAAAAGAAVLVVVFSMARSSASRGPA